MHGDTPLLPHPIAIPRLAIHVSSSMCSHCTCTCSLEGSGVPGLQASRMWKLRKMVAYIVVARHTKSDAQGNRSPMARLS